MRAEMSRAEALAWLGIDEWFVRQPSHAAHVMPLSSPVAAEVPSAHDSQQAALIGSPTHTVPDPLAASASPAPIFPAAQVAGSSSSALLNVVYCAAPHASPHAAQDPLWDAIHRCIPQARAVVQTAAEPGQAAQIQIGAKSWTLHSLRQNPQLKKQLWRVLVGIDS